MPSADAEGGSPFERGHALFEQQEYEAAAHAFVEAATADPQDAQARFWLGQAYEQLGRYQLALDQYQVGLQLAPYDAEMRRGSARMHAALRSVEQQVQAAPQAVPAAPGRRMTGVVIAAVVCFVGIIVLGIVVAVVVPTLLRAGPPAPPLGTPPEPGPPAVAPEELAPSPEGELVFDFEAPPIGESAGEGTPEVELANTLSELRAAVGQFHARYGCYPAHLDDLVATSAPGGGLDENGNSVPLSGEYQGPTLSTPDGLLPVDPVVGGRTSWAYGTAPPDVGSVRSGAFGVASDGTPYSDF